MTARARVGLLLLGLAVGLVLAGCGSGGGSETGSSEGGGGSGGATASIDVGDGKTIEVEKGKPTIGMFIATTNNDWTRGYIAGAEEEAEALGVPLDVLSAEFDVQRQLTELQDAMQSGKYNTWLLAPVDGNLLCHMASDEAPEDGIVVSIFVLPLCGRDTKPTSQLWSPGTLNYVDGQEALDYNRGFVKAVSEMTPGKRKVAVVFGPELNASTITMTKVLEELEAERPEFEVVATVNTDFTTADALAKTQSLLQANPDIDTVISVYSDITRGLIQAIAGAGRTGEIEVFDKGASKYSISQVKAGTLTATSEYSATGAGKISIREIVNAFEGEQGPRYVDVQRQGSTEDPYMVTKENVDSYVPDY